MESSLRALSRRIWLLTGGGGVLFVLCALSLALLHPKTPANQLVNSRTRWLFLPPIVMVVSGIWVSLTKWRCPHCGAPLRTMYPIPRDCPRCGQDIGLFD